MDALQLFPGDLSRFRVEVVRLSRDHAFRRSGGARDFSGQSNAQSGREGFIFRDGLKRERLQSISRQDRGGFTELYVASWPAASQVIIIHCWQIVVNKR